MGLKFTLSEMEATHSEALGYYNRYKESVESLNSLMEALPASWKSEETQTYERFLEMYKEKYPKLTEAAEMMEKFCTKLEQKKNDFEDAAQQSINSFE